MNCHHVKRSGKPAGWLHSLVCADCRVSRRTDDLLAFGIVQLRSQTSTHTALNRTLAALELPLVGERYRAGLMQRRRTRIRRVAAAAATFGVCGWFSYMDWMPAEMPVSYSQEIPAGIATVQIAADSIFAHAAQQHTDGARFSNPADNSKVVHSIQMREDNLVNGLAASRDMSVNPEMAAAAQFAAANEEALGFAQTALRIPYRENIHSSYQEESEQRDPLARQAVIALLHADAARWLSKRNHWRAFTAALDMISFGTNIEGGGSLEARLQGIDCQRKGRLLLWHLLPGLTGAEASMATERLEEAMRHHAPLHTTLRWERDSGLAIRRDILKNPLWRWPRAPLFASSYRETVPVCGPAMMAISLYGTSNRVIIGNYSRFMDTIEEQWNRPYTPAAQAPLLPTDYVNEAFAKLHNASKVRFENIHCETQNRLLAVALALHVFHVEHGAYPQNLQALCPRYLKKVPTDPFEPKSALHYGPIQGDYLLYSIGPDGVDQFGFAIWQGVPIPGSKQQGVSATEESVGDIIAGHNL